MRATVCRHTLIVAGRAVRGIERLLSVPDPRAGLARVLRSSPQFGGAFYSHSRARLIPPVTLLSYEARPLLLHAAF